MATTNEDELIEVDAVEVQGDGSEEIQSAELVIREERETMPAPASVLPSPREWEATLAVAREIAATPFVPESYRGRPESVVAAILTGREMGIGPMQSLRQIHMIDGRPAFAADLMLAKMRQGGLMILDSSIDDERAWIKAKRRDTGEEASVEWRYEEATQIMRKGKPLSDGVNWKNYRQDMLWARCVGRLARRLGSDLLGGLVYSKEEMEDMEDGGYGGAPGYDATTSLPFDPGRDLLPGAIEGEGFASRIQTALNEIDPSVVWPDVIAACVTHVWSVDDRRKLSAPQTEEFWRRLSNAIAKMQDLCPPGSFPPITDAQITEAFAFAFGGFALDEVPHHEVDAAALTREEAELADQTPDDIPFGEEAE